MDGSSDNDAALACEQTRPQLSPEDALVLAPDVPFVFFDPVQARVVTRHGHHDYEGMTMIGGPAFIGGGGTRSEALYSRDADGSAQNNGVRADAGEEMDMDSTSGDSWTGTIPAPAGTPALEPSSYDHGFVLLVPRHEDAYLFGFMLRGHGHGHMDGYGDDAYRGGGFGAVPASDDEIARLEKATVGDTREAECVVCMESFQEGDEIRKMPCSHGFHEACIFKWLRVSRLCPHCRFAMPADDKWLTGYEDDVAADAPDDHDEGYTYFMEM